MAVALLIQLATLHKGNYHKVLPSKIFETKFTDYVILVKDDWETMIKLKQGVKKHEEKNF